MSSRYVTKNGRTMKRGLFSNGIWHCDCDPRMPADKFQTKNGGKNHGRWFYTCQKPQPKRCSFFLWEDDAKVREEGAVLSNSRSEPAEPRTPQKIRTPAKQTKLPAQFPTPSTKSKTPVKLEAIPPPPAANEFDDWSSDADADLAEALDEFETPRKAARNGYDDSPSKNRTTSASTRSDASSVTLPLLDDPAEIFTTPSTSKKAPNIHSNSTKDTSTATAQLPTPGPGFSSTSADPGPLAVSALSLLSPLPLTSAQSSQLISLLNTHELRTTGISKGRDIARLALQSKDRKITELEARIKGLEMEKETMRSVVGCLKSDIANSPKRPRRPRVGGGGDAEHSGEQQQSGGWERGRSAASGNGRVNRSVV